MEPVRSDPRWITANRHVTGIAAAGKRKAAAVARGGP